MRATAVWKTIGELRYAYYAVISFNVIVGAFYYKRMDIALKIFFFFLLVMYINEIFSIYFQQEYGSSSAVSHIYSIFELALISVYFIYTVFEKPKKILIAAVVLLSSLFGIGDIYIQKINTYNSYMLVLECLIICPQALYVLYKFSDREDILKLSEYPHFYIWRSLLVLWSVTFFYWSFVLYLKGSDEYPMILLYYTLLNIMVYIPIGYALLKLRPKFNNLTKA